MILDFIIALLEIAIVWIVGQGIICRLFGEEECANRNLLSYASGFSVLTLLTTFFYFTCRMPVQVIRFIWICLGIVLLLWLILLIPGISGGDQYYVYRGNCADQQTYVEETVALSTHSIGWYEERTREEIELVSDVLWRGYNWAVKDRPSAGLMIAVMRANPAGEIY